MNFALQFQRKINIPFLFFSLLIFLPFLLFAQKNNTLPAFCSETEKIFSENFKVEEVKKEFFKHNTVPESEMDKFTHYAQNKYSEDRRKFFDEYNSGKIKKENIPSYFSHLKAKYINLYPVYLAEKKNNDLKGEDDDFTLQYKKGSGNGEVKSPNGPCVNMNFENGDYTGWDLYKGVRNVGLYNYSNVVTTGPNVQHFIQNVSQGNDPLVPVSRVNPDGGAYSLMLGDSIRVGAQAASVKQTFLVDSNNAVFTYSYAVILEDPAHTPQEQPYFRVRMYDQANNSIVCGEYNVTAGPVSSGGDPDFIILGGVSYKPWSTVFAPLDNYIGQNVTIEFTVGDCEPTGHFGYAYIDADCAGLGIVTSSPVICGGAAITLTAPPGAATYQWSGPGGITGSTQSITTSTPGTYSVNITPVTGSACMVTMTAVIPGSPSVPISSFVASSPCVGTPSQFIDQSSVTGGTITAWHWDFGVAGFADTSNLQSPSFSFPTAGNFDVTLSVTTDAGCIKDTVITVTVIDSFDPTFPADTFCNDEPPVNLTGASPGGVWSGVGITNATNGTFNPSTAGIGTWPISYSGGTGACADTFTTNIIVDGVLINNVAPAHVTCFGANDGAIVIMANGATEYSIDNGATFQASSLFTGLAPGTYSIVVRSAINNCQKTASTTINEPTQLAMQFSAFDVNCHNACDGYAVVIPSGAISPYTYIWNTGTGNIATATGLCNGTYSLTVKDVNNCSIDTTFTIVQPDSFSINIVTANSNCGHPDGSAEIVSISGQTPPYSYIWSNNDPDSSATGLVNNTYFVTVTDSKGCDTVLNATVGFNPPPGANADSTKISCNGVCDGKAFVTASGGNPAGLYTYLWNTGATTDTISALCAGTYNVTVYDSKLCEGFATVEVVQPPPITVTMNPNETICIGRDAVVGVSDVTGGNGANYSFSWNNSLSPTQYNTVSPASNTCYTVTVTDNNNCPALPKTQCITFYPPLQVFAMGSITICEGNPATVSAFALGGHPDSVKTYSWMNDNTGASEGNGTPITVFPQGSNPGSVLYIVTASDNCSPSASDSVVIDFFPQPVADLVADTTFVCVPYTITFTNTSSPSDLVNCYWTLGDGTVEPSNCGSFTHQYDAVGQYDVSLTVISAEGCMEKKSIPKMITVNPNPEADFIFSPHPTDVQNMTIKFTDMSQGLVNQWYWSYYDNDGTTLLGNSPLQNSSFNFASEPDNPFIYYLTDTGDYPVQLWVKTMDGCIDSITREVRVDGVFYANVPNAFTPNNDGVNDYFFPVGVGINPGEDFRFIILDRWGDIIFESKSLDDPWDGTARSVGGKEIVKQDVYIWKLELKDVTRLQEKHKHTGHVTLLR